jgi:TolB-like protein/Tfp pilus assembly protein PilF
MPSLVSGYEYDIFISYRQKDNRGERWVTEFVNSLKTELDAAFKDDISIYFDENPHDGLLETHNVDKSLEGKLKCLIFIPIISQTYCDPKSFAWQQEFCVFNKLSQEDQFGRDVRLTNGNVTSRILPVRIHDLDAEDKTLIEAEIGGMLRAVDFIYKTPGVNRPLRVVEEHPQSNQYKTLYRDQINKVANAVKEILTVLHHPQSHSVNIRASENKIVQRSRLKKIIVGGALFWIVGIIGFAIYSNSSKPKPSQLKSIAVLSFDNLSSDKEQEFFSQGLTDDIGERLTKIKSLRVIPNNAIREYRALHKTLPQIYADLGVDYVLDGSVRRQGNKVKVVARLTDIHTSNAKWTEAIEKETADLFLMQGEIASKLARYLQLSLTADEYGDISTILTNNIQAYDLYLLARELSNTRRPKETETAIRYLRKATKIDPQFTQAYNWLANCYNQKFVFERNTRWIDSSEYFTAKELQMSPRSYQAYFNMAYSYRLKGRMENSYQALMKGIRLGQTPGLFGSIAFHMVDNHRLDSAIYYSNKIFKLKDLFSTAYRLGWRNRGLYYLELGWYDSASYYFEKSYLIDPDHVDIIMPKAYLFTLRKEYVAAAELIQKQILDREIQDDVYREGADLMAKLYALQNDWDNVVRFLQGRKMNDDPRLALAYQKMGKPELGRRIIADKKKQFETDNFLLGLARIALLENKPDMAAAYYDSAYSTAAIWSYQIRIDPFARELEGNTRFVNLMKSIEGEHQVAGENIKMMYKPQ